MLKLYNTLSRKIEEFTPLNPPHVGIYSCGPTVYWNQHIGHMYAYVVWDTLVRLLRAEGCDVKWVMNITDVGHLTSDADVGEDKMEKGAKREGLTVWEIADKYLGQYLKSVDLLNIQRPNVLCRATEHIEDQINLAKKIEENGFAYLTKTGLVFDTAKFSGYADFAKLKLEKQEAGARVKVDLEKKNPWDFLLWVTNQPKHIMKWASSWGEGFPGWHIECTAMSIKYLGEQFDIHTGGKEHIPVHHTNEVAQAYGAYGRQTANYWLHNDWLTMKGEKISKSLGNMILVTDLIEKGFDPMALRYLILTSHYRQGLDFTWESIQAAQNALNNLREIVRDWPSSVIACPQRFACDSRRARNEVTKPARNASLAIAGGQSTAEDSHGRRGDLGMTENYYARFMDALNNDLNTPQALAVMWDMVKSDSPSSVKAGILLEMDKVLGLKLDEYLGKKVEVPEEVQKLVAHRENARKSGDFKKSDELRHEIKKLGYEIKDTPTGAKIKRNYSVFPSKLSS